MTRVKICGLTREEDVDAAVDAGADAVGFVLGFASSPRNLSVARAASLISRVPPFVTPVLVATGSSLAENSDPIKRMGPKAIQLYGGAFSPDSVRDSFHASVIRPFPVRREGEEESDFVPRANDALKGCDALLTDTAMEGAQGGTGLTSDWSTCAAIRRSIRPRPLILSGGLRAENLEIAIAAVEPFCVDVSSGVEASPGVKDHQKVREFVAKAAAVEGRRVAL